MDAYIQSAMKPSTPQSSRASSITTHALAQLPITFLVLGGGIAGLACALALARVGHAVVVLEKDCGEDPVAGGIRMCPNLVKTLHHWGLDEQLREFSVESEDQAMLLYETGEVLGKHHWDDAALRAMGGEFEHTHHTDLRELLRDTAIRLGVEIRHNAEVISINSASSDAGHGSASELPSGTSRGSYIPPNPISATIASGEILTADVLIGADGQWGLCRQAVMEANGESERVMPLGITMYNTTVPLDKMQEDPALDWMLKQQAVFTWYGDDRFVIGYPVGGHGGTNEFALHIYGPHEEDGRGSWDEQVPIEEMQDAMGDCEPRLKKLAALGHPPSHIPLVQCAELEDWVDDSGRMVLVGEAAHPLPPGAKESSAMAVEDAAVLAELFGHLTRADQITSFLYAFQELRQKRCAAVLEEEIHNIEVMAMPPGEQQKARDEAMRRKRDAGEDAFDRHAPVEEHTEEYRESEDIYAYEAEEDAEDWYAHWDGKKERSVPNSAMTAHFPFPLTVMETVQVSTECIVAEISTSITI